jgi:diguanylate cyclase (GGDEF)-like protein
LSVDTAKEKPVSLPRLLIVDDDPASLRLLNAILEGVAKIHFATSGEEALRQVARHEPDLILLDVDMPGLGGHATCAVLKADPISAELPVIFVTSCADTASETQALALGAVDFIHKPVNAPVVLARVKTHLALKQKSDQLRRLTMMDSLTGIANRRAFDDSLHLEWQRLLRHGESLSLLMIDIDYFKRYNDAHGHPAGDSCLRQVAIAIADTAKRTGDLAARYGGEEFAVILPHTGEQDARTIAERICACVRALAIAHGDSPVAPHVTISIGVASMTTAGAADCQGAAGSAQSSVQDSAPDSTSSCLLITPARAAPETLVGLADQALYTAKHQGRDRMVMQSGKLDPGWSPTASVTTVAVTPTPHPLPQRLR